MHDTFISEGNYMSISNIVHVDIYILYAFFLGRDEDVCN